MKVSLFLISILFSLNTYSQTLSKATFAGGCFWCMEPPFEKLKGVKSVISGYGGGTKANPTYKDVSSGSTKHREVVQVTYDPKLVSFEKLVKVFWQNIDPTDPNGQFVDQGFQYTSAIYYHDEEQKKISESSIKELNKLKIFKKPIVTKLEKFTTFYPAEDYHQDYYKKSKIKYKFYRFNSGRDKFINKYWDKKAKDSFDKSKLK